MAPRIMFFGAPRDPTIDVRLSCNGRRIILLRLLEFPDWRTKNYNRFEENIGALMSDEKKVLHDLSCARHSTATTNATLCNGLTIDYRHHKIFAWPFFLFGPLQMRQAPLQESQEMLGQICTNSCCRRRGRWTTGISSHLGAKLRDLAVTQAGSGCYPWAALSSNDSKTRYIQIETSNDLLV